MEFSWNWNLKGRLHYSSPTSAVVQRLNAALTRVATLQGFSSQSEKGKSTFKTFTQTTTSVTTNISDSHDECNSHKIISSFKIYL